MYADQEEYEAYLQSGDAVLDHGELYSSVSSSSTHCCVRLCRFLFVFLRHRMKGVVMPWIFLIVLGVSCGMYGYVARWRAARRAALSETSLNLLTVTVPFAGSSSTSWPTRC